MYCTEQMRETYNVWAKNLKGRHSLEDLDKNGLKRTVKKESGNWICLAQDSEEWRVCKSDVWLTVHRNSVWIRKTN